jgi:hypothetical protein
MPVQAVGHNLLIRPILDEENKGGIILLPHLNKREKETCWSEVLSVGYKVKGILPGEFVRTVKMPGVSLDSVGYPGLRIFHQEKIEIKGVEDGANCDSGESR